MCIHILATLAQQMPLSVGCWSALCCADYKSSSNSPNSHCSPTAVGSHRLLDVGGSASPHAHPAAGTSSNRQPGVFSSNYNNSNQLGTLQQPVSLPSPTASGLSRSGHAWDHNGGIDTGSSSGSSQEQQQQQQHTADSGGMQPMEDRMSPQVSRSASSSSLAAAAAAASNGGFGQANSILACRSPQSPAGAQPSSGSPSSGSFTRGNSSTSVGSPKEADQQKR